MINITITNLTNNHAESVLDIEFAMREMDPPPTCHPLDNPSAACLTALAKSMLRYRKIDIARTPISMRLDDYYSAKPEGTYTALDMDIRMTPLRVYISEPRADEGKIIWRAAPQPDPKTGRARSAYAADCSRLVAEPDVYVVD